MPKELPTWWTLMYCVAKARANRTGVRQYVGYFPGIGWRITPHYRRPMRAGL